MLGRPYAACWCFPGGPDGKRIRQPGFNLWVGKIPWRREWQPTLVFLKNTIDRGAWRATVLGLHIVGHD